MDNQQCHKNVPADAGPRLYLLPVPLSDVAPENVMPATNTVVASGIKYFIVENLRTARRWLKRFDRNIDIDSLTFYVLDEHTLESEVAAMLEPMKRGCDMAVMSEAGCPAVADPGALAVAQAQRMGYEVVPLVGPSSLLLALMASGFNGQSFTFHGYLPYDTEARQNLLRRMCRTIDTEHSTQIFIETPYRNNRLIAELCQRLPADMLLCVASDITGPSQSIVTRTVAGWKHVEYSYDKIPTIFLIYR